MTIYDDDDLEFAEPGGRMLKVLPGIQELMAILDAETATKQ